MIINLISPTPFEENRNVGPDMSVNRTSRLLCNWVIVFQITERMNRQNQNVIIFHSSIADVAKLVRDIDQSNQIE